MRPQGDADVVLLTSASKVSVELNGGIFDVSPTNDRASPNVKTPVESMAAASLNDVSAHLASFMFDVGVKI